MRGRIAILAVAAAWSSACALAAYPCLSRQQRGAVVTLDGTVDAGAVVQRDVAYGALGSQNDLRIKWNAQGTVDGPRIAVYATSVACEDAAAAAAGRGPCAHVGSIGSTFGPDARPCAKDGTCRIEPRDLVQTALTIANGRGNPERLGVPPMYRLWIVGDQRQAASYSIAVTWFYGPDC